MLLPYDAKIPSLATGFYGTAMLDTGWMPAALAMR